MGDTGAVHAALQGAGWDMKCWNACGVIWVVTEKKRSFLQPVILNLSATDAKSVIQVNSQLGPVQQYQQKGNPVIQSSCWEVWVHLFVLPQHPK